MTATRTRPQEMTALIPLALPARVVRFQGVNLHIVQDFTVRCACTHRETEHTGRCRAGGCLCAEFHPVTITAE